MLEISKFPEIGLLMSNYINISLEVIASAKANGWSHKSYNKKYIF